MMRSVVLSIPVISVLPVLQTYAKELMTPIGTKPDTVHKGLIDRMQDQWLLQQLQQLRYEHSLQQAKQADKQADLDVTTLGKPGHIATSHQSLLSCQPRPLFQNFPLRVQPLRLQSTWRRTVSPQSGGFLLLQLRPLFRNSPIPRRLQSPFRNSRAEGSGSSGAKPQREGRHCGGHNRNRGNPQRSDNGSGNRDNAQHYDHGNHKGLAPRSERR